MFKKVMKTMGSLILALTMIFSLSTAVAAGAGVPDLDETGSISVTPKRTDGDNSVVMGMSFTRYYVAHIGTDADNNLVYELDGDFSKCGEDLSKLSSTAGLANALANFVRQNSLTGQEGKADETTGTVKFDNLALGLYLLIQNDTGTGYEVAPFLVSVPRDVDNKWVYNVDGSPKASVKKIPTDTPTPTPSVTPTATPEPTPSVTPEVTPSTTPEVTPSTTPEATPSVTPSTTPEVTPSETPSVTPSVTPEASVTPTPEVTQTPTPTGTEVTATPTPSGGSDTNPTSTPAEKLVQTGQLNWPIPVLALAGILLFGIGWALNNLNKREK